MAKHAYCRHSSRISVPFFDVDAMHIVWHGHYVKYLEIARCAFLDSIAYNYLDMEKHGYAWPVVKVELKYIKPARFGQELRVDLQIIEYESCLKILYRIIDIDSGQTLTQAMTMQVPVELASGETQFETPASWRAAIAKAPDFQPWEK